MPSDRYADEYERAAGGLDYDDVMRDRASKIGANLFERGPGALLDEVEELLPEAWREQIRTFPIGAIVVGAAVGFFLGYRKGHEILAAGSSLLAAAAAANVNQFVNSRVAGHDEE